MAPRGKGQKTWSKSKNAKTLGGERAREAAKAAAAAKAEIAAAAKLAAASERVAKATPKPDRAVDPEYHKSDRQDLP